ncbi:hypothetical protein TNCV_248391 [Trichonephila clavipes]|nr:hypothetical protein TNCV_248391 [Trichonephila clavipes]
MAYSLYNLSELFPNPRAAKTVPVTTPPCHLRRTNQDPPINQGPPTSGHIYNIRHGMEERSAFHFPVTTVTATHVLSFRHLVQFLPPSLRLSSPLDGHTAYKDF